MNAKENALEILRFGKPEKVIRSLPGKWISYLGANHQGYNDISLSDGHDRPVGSKWRDIWDTEWHKEYDGIMGFPKYNPLANTNALSSYKFPDSNDERIYRQIYQSSEDFKDRENTFLIGSNRDTLWEKAYMLVGMENMMIYFYEEPRYVKEVLNKIMNFQLGIAQHYVNVGIEVASLSDDLGTQRGLLLSPEIIQEFLVPEYERLLTFYKKHNVKIEFHSCGHIEPLIPTFIKLGVDILNPIQATANNLSAIRKASQGHITLHGGISSDLLIKGTRAEIYKDVEEKIKLLGCNGGYFCDVDQHMPFPEDNLKALDDAIELYGVYSSSADISVND